MRNIHIFYSHYNVEGTGQKSRPAWFDYEKCFINLLNSIEDKPHITIHLIMDGKIDDNWIKKYQDKYISHEIKGGNIDDVTTNLYKIVYDLDCSEDDLIYILENDYVHVPEWEDKIQTLYSEFENLSYVSLYDHYDKYFLPMYDELVSKLWVTNNHHWRLTPSTCGSYITTKKIFNEDYLDHTGVTVPIGDHHKWLFLSENKNRFMITPVPGLSTHCMEGLLSQTINWQTII